MTIDSEAYPSIDLDLDMRSVRATILDDEGDLLLIISDGDFTVSIDPGFAKHDECIAAALAIASTAITYGQRMRERRDKPPSARRHPRPRALP